MKILSYIISAFLIVYMVGTLILVVQQKREIEDLRMQQHFEHARNYQVENELRREDYQLNKELAEFQRWRVHVTTAARMGWQTADRYMRNYPLKFKYADDGGNGMDY